MFNCLLEDLVNYQSDFILISRAIAELDLFHSFAWKAKEASYVRPVVSLEGELELLSSRHPVVETVVGKHKYVPNDIVIESSSKTLLITGPNMAGKSTVMRQTAISAILHQIGSFVPASKAVLPIFDRVFTRVGAADDLSRGQSTFMVEMAEAAEILRQATNHSLVILDEVGRGTSTQDGLAIASAILENIALDISCYSLFATHYHELSELADKLENVENVQIEVKENETGVEFTHRMVKGSSGSSYGIEVAKLAGIPENVVKRAQFYISVPSNKEMKSDSVSSEIVERKSLSSTGGLGLDEGVDSSVELNNFEKTVISKLRKHNLNKTTPMQALNLLDKLQKRAF